MKELADEAVVLRTYKSGEADRVGVVWTRHHGKVRLLAKGVRKTASRMGGSLEPLTHVSLDLVKSRGDLYVTRHVSHLSRFTTLRDSYERITAGMAVVEVVDAIPTDESADEELFELIVRVLQALDNPEFHPGLVATSFYLRLLAHDGSAPMLDECVNCASAGPLVAFDALVGGALCVNCRTGTGMSTAALDLMRRITGGQLASVLREVDPPAAGEVAALAQSAIENHFGRRLKVARSTAPLASNETL